ncbi:MAG TPA: hypothetical protein VEG43_02235 [Dehalococcoidia bacterium]|nr:hypothetical protein [Dehalococcoidia bacterium]
MTRILKSSIGLLLAVLLMSGGASAYFGYAKADAAIMPDAGKPSLKIGGDGSRTGTFNVSNLVPGSSGSGSIRPVNVGNQTGQLGISFSSVTNTPAVIGEYMDGSGDLGAYMEIAVYIDVNGSGDWNNGDIGLKPDSTTYAYPTALEYDALDNYSNITWKAIKSMTASAACDFIITWHIPIIVGNEIQGDSVSFDINFFIVS